MNWRSSATLAALARMLADRRRRRLLASGVFAGACLLALVVFTAFSLPRPVDRTLSAAIFENGAAVGETTIALEGELLHTPFSEFQTYTGRLWLGCFDPARKPQSDAILKWVIPSEECVLLPRPGSVSTFAEIEAIYADLELRQITIQLADGTVISTEETPPPELLKA